MYKILELLYMVVVVLQGYCLKYFFGSFLESRLKNRLDGFCVMAFYTVGIYSIRTVFDKFGLSTDMEAIWKLVLSLCILFILAICFYKAFCPIAVFLVVTFQAVADISRYAAVILLDKLGDSVVDIWNWCIQKRLFTSDKILRMTLNGGTLIVQILRYLMIVLLLYVSLRKIVKDFKEKDYEIRKTELLFLLTPAATSLLICVLLRIIMITLKNNIPEMLYNRYPILVIVLPVILFLSLLSILYSVKLFQDMIYRNKTKNEKIILQNQVSSLQQHMEEMERIYSEIRGIKHDMKNTIAVIQQLCAEENKELREYLSGIDQTFDQLDMRFRTGNTVADTLLNMKYHEAVRVVSDLKIDTDKLFFPQDLKIHSYDIGVVLGNALDNAIEACKKLKEKEHNADVFIRFASMQKGNLLVIKIENSFDGQLLQKPQAEFPITDKPDRENHGMGLANIKNTVEKYHGTIDFKVNGKIFILSIMVKNERGNK